MRIVSHLPDLSACPHLPHPVEPQTAQVMRRFGKGRGVDFYLGALECAQSLWLQGLPAQAMLQLNRAFSCVEAHPDWPWPYAAMAWMMRNRREDHFVGNPRRHFQHLATRMVPPHKELRVWRAWACWALACRIFPDFPADEEQLERENLTEPELNEVGSRLSDQERQLWLAALETQ